MAIIVVLTRTAMASPHSSRKYKPELSGHQSRAAFPDVDEAFPEDEDHLNKLERINDLDSHRILSEADRDYVLALIDYLIDKRHVWTWREAAARYLGIYGHSLAIPALLAVIRDDHDNVQVRKRAIIALGKIRDKRNVMYLVEDGLGSGERPIINAAWEALINFVSDVPSKIKDVSYMGGFKPPPGTIIPPGIATEDAPPIDPEKLEEYLDIWREWWRKNHENVTVHRSSWVF